MIENNKINRKFPFAFSFLILLFLLIRIPILLTFRGILGGNESFEINKLIYLLLYSNRTVHENLLDLFFHYDCLLPLLQVPFTFPFFLMMPTNEFGSFLGSLTVSSFTLFFLFYFCFKHFNISVAIFSSLLFIFSPFGFTVKTISSCSSGNNLILFSMVLYFCLFFNNKFKLNLLSMSLLALLPLLSPIHFFLWPCCFLYIFLKVRYGEKSSASVKRNIFIGFVIFSFTLLALSPAYTAIFKSIPEFGISNPQDAGIYDYFAPFQFEKEHIKLRLAYYGGPFMPFQCTVNDLIRGIAYISLILSISLFIISNLYFCFSFIKNRTVRPHLLLTMYSLSFIALDLFINKRFMGWMSQSLAIITHYLSPFLLVSMIVISCFIDKRTKFRFVFYILIGLNLILNLSMITSITNNNNYRNYNLGNIDYAEKKNIQLPIKRKLLLRSIKIGIHSRETDPIYIKTLNNIDYKLYGYGMKIWYNNEIGINFCNILTDKESESFCKNGYLMDENEVMNYIYETYPSNNDDDLLDEDEVKEFLNNTDIS